jgi:uncharacterized protein DUF2877
MRPKRPLPRSVLPDGLRTMTLSNSTGHVADHLDIVVPILRSGVLARQFCERVAFANVEAVFERCLYLRCDGDFVCIGDPDIGNGPLTLIGDLRHLPRPKSLAGQIASISDERITIGSSIRFALSESALWRASDWPLCPSPDRLIDLCGALASRAAIRASHEGLARCVIGAEATVGLARLARPRIKFFEGWVSEVLDGRPGSAGTSRKAVQGLIGLGPGLTPSGDDFLLGALAVLAAIGESAAHAAMARAILDALPGLTTSLSGCFLRAAAAGHVGENLHRVVSSIMTDRLDAAVAAAGKIGHSSGWDMMAGILTMLRLVTERRKRCQPAS